MDAHLYTLLAKGDRGLPCLFLVVLLVVLFCCLMVLKLLWFFVVVIFNYCECPKCHRKVRLRMCGGHPPSDDSGWSRDVKIVYICKSCRHEFEPERIRMMDLLKLMMEFTYGASAGFILYFLVSMLGGYVDEYEPFSWEFWSFPVWAIFTLGGGMIVAVWGFLSEKYPEHF